MSETQVCEICGRVCAIRWETDEDYDGELCWRAFQEKAKAHSTGISTCYRLGYERARAALSAAEKQLEDCANGHRSLKELHDARVAAEKREARLRDLLARLLVEAGEIGLDRSPGVIAARAELKESEGREPAKSLGASSTQEGEKAPADSRDPPPETA